MIAGAMKRIAIVFALSALLVTGVSPTTASAAGETQVTAAARGLFPANSSFNGIPLSGSTFGLGSVLDGIGGAVGDFEIVLAGTTPLGQPQDITLIGKVSGGTVNDVGNVTITGTGTLDMGDGSLPLSVPFAAVVTLDGLQLTIGTTALPTQALSEGSVFIGP